METLVEVTLKKVHILEVLDCYYRLFPLTYVSYDPKGIMIQGSNEDPGILVTTVIPQDSLEHYECREPAVVVVPNHLKELDGRCVRITVLRVDSWRVRNVFKSNNGVPYEAICHMIHKLLAQPRLDSGISFERYPEWYSTWGYETISLYYGSVGHLECIFMALLALFNEGV